MKTSFDRNIFLHDMQTVRTCSQPPAASYRCFFSVFVQNHLICKEFFPHVWRHCPTGLMRTGHRQANWSGKMVRGAPARCEFSRPQRLNQKTVAGATVFENLRRSSNSPHCLRRLREYHADRELTSKPRAITRASGGKITCCACASDPGPFPWQDAIAPRHRPEQPSDNQPEVPTFHGTAQASDRSGSSSGA